MIYKSAASETNSSNLILSEFVTETHVEKKQPILGVTDTQKIKTIVGQGRGKETWGPIARVVYCSIFHLHTYKVS